MGAPDVLAQLTALGIHLHREGDVLVAEPKSALTDTARALIRANKAGLLETLTAQSPGKNRMARALAYLEVHPGVKRACFADLKADPENVILTVAVRDPWGAVELAVPREKFDPLALMELSLRYPDTALSVGEH